MNIKEYTQSNVSSKNRMSHWITYSITEIKWFIQKIKKI